MCRVVRATGVVGGFAHGAGGTFFLLSWSWSFGRWSEDDMHMLKQNLF